MSWSVAVIVVLGVASFIFSYFSTHFSGEKKIFPYLFLLCSLMFMIPMVAIAMNIVLLNNINIYNIFTKGVYLPIFVVLAIVIMMFIANIIIYSLANVRMEKRR
jgi:hypothetical protein